MPKTIFFLDGFFFSYLFFQFDDFFGSLRADEHQMKNLVCAACCLSMQVSLVFFPNLITVGHAHCGAHLLHGSNGKVFLVFLAPFCYKKFVVENCFTGQFPGNAISILAAPHGPDPSLSSSFLTAGLGNAWWAGRWFWQNMVDGWATSRYLLHAMLQELAGTR